MHMRNARGAYIEAASIIASRSAIVEINIPALSRVWSRHESNVITDLHIKCLRGGGMRHVIATTADGFGAI